MTRHPSALRRYLACESGTLTMEFMLWLPILLFWFVISAVFYDAYRTRDAAAKASYTISDIVSRSIEIDDSMLGDLVTLQRSLLPRAGATMFMRLSAIRCIDVDGCTDLAAASQGDYTAVWSIVPDQPAWPEGFVPPAVLTDGDLPIELMPPMDTLDEVVLIDVSVPFVPFADWVGINAQQWDFRIVVRPRFVPSIALTAGGGAGT